MVEYFVGQKVMIRDINEGTSRGPGRGTVTTVGRRLVRVMPESYDKYPSAMPEVFRIETGIINDKYEHSWIQTMEQYGESVRSEAAEKRLREYRVQMYGYSADVMEHVLQVLDWETLGESND